MVNHHGVSEHLHCLDTPCIAWVLQWFCSLSFLETYGIGGTDPTCFRTQSLLSQPAQWLARGCITYRVMVLAVSMARTRLGPHLCYRSCSQRRIARCCTARSEVGFAHRTFFRFANMVQATECQQLGDLTVTSAMRPRHVTSVVKHRTQLLGLAQLAKWIAFQHTIFGAVGCRYRACWCVCLHTPAPCVPNG
jgi:hypothetical protein